MPRDGSALVDLVPEAEAAVGSFRVAYDPLAAVAVMTGMALAWYALVACVLTLRPAAAVFARLRRWIDLLAGVAFIGLGTRLALER